MICTSPFRLKQKDGSVIELPCGHCTGCKIARAREWASRIIHEMVYYEKSTFITLTYDDDHLPEDESISKDELQRFFKRLRKLYPPKSIKYFACGEYGDQKGRPHYHAIVFGIGNNDEDKENIKKTWEMGKPFFGTVTFNSARYVTAYVMKKYSGELVEKTYGKKQQPFCLMSKGIGKRFVIDNQEQLNQNQSFTVQGSPVGLPRYYKGLIDLDKQSLREIAIERSKKIIDTFKERGISFDDDFEWKLIQEKKKSREQAEKTLNAKINLYRRKL